MHKANVQKYGDPSSAVRGRGVPARLLEAAADLIGEIGWNAVSTRILAERAGVGAGLVHYHFDSLQALLRAAALVKMHNILDDVSAAATEVDGPVDGLEAMLSQLDEYTGIDSSSLLVIEAYLAATRDPELRAQMAELVRGWRATMADVLTRIGHPNPDAAAILILAVLDGLFLQKALDRDLSHTEVAPLLRQLLHLETKEGNG